MKYCSVLTTWRRLVLVAIAAISIFAASDLINPQPAAAYPFWAQETAPITPREATGRIVCANCHLGAKPTEVEVPHSVLPDTVFKAVVNIPYDTSVQQVLGDGSPGGLNVGAVLMLPEGFKIAPEDRLSEELKEETEGIYYQTYTADQENVILVGPLPGDDHQEIVFPVLSPDPKADKSINYGKYAIHVGGNRGRGQVYPAGDNTNNTVSSTSVAGTISSISELEYGGYEVTIQPADADAVVTNIPAGPELIVSEGDEVAAGQALTNNPNVGGFGQIDTEIVLQDATRIQGMIAFLVLIMITQIFLVLKKKQFEKVQAAEMNF
ncbi:MULTISPECIES: cytochrome f [unclassified Roseofilum]|uniref:cytochrome f n=1 Tax=unclassified Roseofilum TaxID=2620099 RepID=UPI000E999827|nr:MULTISPECIES: apocytochrome f [unclassified Roseofilum]HBQ97910.1 apocytochrome f [Cyanobacteria bacterium UBA11691]MBP0010395.1 apocytochrome f [Roseofilum sp. Belize Diploria]MBP0015270.1 apocytochrome f [Roseofilum sp. SID3]MBP0031940.1 apocytochrome f [Roseofilum sp. Belize BBD 4]MBP0036256.1 apocytochrome f [Roseofilum sp. SID1]